MTRPREGKEGKVIGEGRFNNGIGADWYDIRAARNPNINNINYASWGRTDDPRALAIPRLPLSGFPFFITSRNIVRTYDSLLLRMPIYLPEPELRAALTLTYRPHHARTGAPHKTEEDGREETWHRGETMRSVDDMRANPWCAALSVKPTNGNRSLDSRMRKGHIQMTMGTSRWHVNLIIHRLNYSFYKCKNCIRTNLAQ